MSTRVKQKRWRSYLHPLCLRLQLGKIRCKGAYAHQVEVSLLPPCVQADWAGREYVACQYNKTVLHQCLADERQRDVSLNSSAVCACI